MRLAEEWVSFTWYCSNCGTLVTGFKNQNGDIRVECSRCRAVMVRRVKNKRCDSIDVYAPRGLERQVRI